MKTTLLILATLSSFVNQAQAEFSRAKCEEVLTRSGVVQVNRQWDANARRCFISISPRNIVDLKYRDYYFDNSGQMMVFNSYGNGPDSETTGARVFYLFPVVNDYPDYSFEPNGDVIIKLVSGHEFKVSGKDFSIVSLSGGILSEKPLSKTNGGGVEIKLTEGFWMDAGFKMGGTRLESPKNKSTLKAAGSSNSCSLQNNSFLNYSGFGDYDFKYSGITWLSFLKNKCPQLNLK